MEPLDGLEFTRIVRNQPDSPYPFVPIILLTSQGAFDRVQEVRDNGVTEFLVKPVMAQALYTRIANVIQKPRQFMRASEYFGPDRRRTIKDFRSEERRANTEEDENEVC